jgi:hypothetical protein
MRIVFLADARPLPLANAQQAGRVLRCLLASRKALIASDGAPHHQQTAHPSSIKALSVSDGTPALKPTLFREPAYRRRHPIRPVDFLARCTHTAFLRY